jgi:low temperature requirement protein LtrA
MSGRDPHEPHRAATPLELLFDLTFVIAFGVAASQFAHILATGGTGAGLAGFSFATFAVSWAWINFILFAGLIAIELTGPLLAEKRMTGTPWHGTTSSSATHC